jgi:hypothetical protein
MLEELAERNFPPGAVMPRKWLVQDAPRIHAELGGALTTADPISQAKKARAALLEGEWEQAGYGNIRRLGDPRTGEDAYGNSVTLDLQEAELSLNAEQWFGDGDETVYCYTFPCYIELASLKGDSKMPMKIGKTSSKSLERVLLQCGVSNPELPLVPLAIRVDDAALFEKAIQRILTIWDRWIDDAPGSEWFMTSKDEILEIVGFLNNPPSPGAPRTTEKSPNPKCDVHEKGR